MSTTDRMLRKTNHKSGDVLEINGDIIFYVFISLTPRIWLADIEMSIIKLIDKRGVNLSPIHGLAETAQESCITAVYNYGVVH